VQVLCHSSKHKQTANGGINNANITNSTLSVANPLFIVSVLMEPSGVMTYDTLTCSVFVVLVFSIVVSCFFLPGNAA